MTGVERKRALDLDALLGHQFNVLSSGFVRAVDYMGTDRTIVQAARISYGAGTKTVSEDEGLIRYLMRNRHTTPFEMCSIMLHIRIPMDAWRQMIRHRTASVNEYSTRYSEAIDEMDTTKPDVWRTQSKSNKQGSSGFFDAEEDGKFFTMDEKECQDTAKAIYKHRLKRGVAREQARKDLPLSTYTEAYWKMDLHNLFHFLSLRMDSHAQKEIRDYATIIGEKIVAPWVPMAWQAFVDYRLEGMHLSRLEIEAMKARDASGITNKRELDDFVKKCEKLELTYE